MFMLRVSASEKKLVREDFAKIRNDLREKMERTAFKDMKNLV